MTMNPFLENYLLDWQIFHIPFHHINPWFGDLEHLMTNVIDIVKNNKYINC